MIVKVADPRAANVLPWEPLPFDEEPVPPVESRWLNGTYPWEEEGRMSLDELKDFVHETSRRLDDLEASQADRRRALVYIETQLGRLNAYSRRGIASWSGKAGEYAKRTATEVTA